jgi:hypothetical protein
MALPLLGLGRLLMQVGKKAAPKALKGFKKQKAKSIRNKGIGVGLTGAGVTGGLGALKIKSILNEDYQKASSMRKNKKK